MRRRGTDQAGDAPVPPKNGRRSEAGDTLIEILIALTVIGVAATAILLAFATTISGSSDHRNFVTMDTMLRTAAAEVTSAIQQQSTPDFVNCSGAFLVNNTSILLPNNPSPAVQYTASITGVAYWDTSTNPPGFTNPAAPTNAGCPSGVSSSVPGPQQLTITVTPSRGGASQTITTVVQNPYAPTPPSGCVNAQGQPTTATQLSWVQQPANGTAGSALYPPPTVVLEDANGCVETNDASAVQLAIDSYAPPTGSGLSAGTLGNCDANLGQGETSFTDCSLNTPGTYTLVATDPTDGLTSPQGDPFVISVGVPAKLFFQVNPGNGTGGSPLNVSPAQPITVWIEDSSGNVVSGDTNPITLAIGTNPSNGTLSGCSSTTVNGIAIFSGCKIDKAGNGYTLAATDVGDNLTTPTYSTPFNIAVGPPAQLAFTTSPGGGVTGDKFGTQPLVTIQDLGGNTVTGNTSTVSLAIGANPGGGVLSGCTETTTGGMARFSGCSISKPGNGYTLVATDGTLQSATSNPFNISAAVLTSFSVVPSTTTPTAGSAFTVTITGLDQSGNTFPGFTGPQTIAFSGPANSPNVTKPIYPSPVTFTAGVATATNGVTLYDAQTTTLTATLTTVQGRVAGTSASIAVSPSTAKSLAVSGFPNPTVAGASGSVAVTADDAYGNVATGYRGTVKFTSSDPKAGLPGNYTYTTANAGTNTFSNGVTLNTVGTQSITATDTATGTITGTQSGIAVNKASPTLTTTLSASSIAIGATAHDTSAFTGLVNSTGTATVAYSYYTNNTCTTGAVTVNTVTVPTSGVVPNSSTVTFNTPGTYYWQAVYSGDANNNGATSPCTATNNEQLIVNKASPTIATTLSAGSIAIGTTAHDSSTITGLVNSSGVAGVTYSYYTNNTCTANPVTVNTVTVATNGTVPNSSTVTFNNAGAYYWQAVYSGDANNNGASSQCTGTNNELLTVNKASPSITTTLSAASIIAGTTAHDSSTITGLVNSTGTGTVTYSYYTNNTCTANAVTVGSVTVPTSGTVPNSPAATLGSVGTYYWQAVYNGDANNNGASSPCTGTNNEQLTVTKASPTIATTLSSGSILAGTTAYDTSTLSGAGNSTGAGTVTYSYYTNNTCTAGHITVGAVTVPTGGAVPNSSTVTFNTVGTYYWQAVYSGDANNNGATSPCTGTNNEQLTVAKGSPTLTAAGPGTGTAGTAITTTNISSVLAASSGANATGTITFTVFGPQATAPTTCTTGGTTVGTGTTVAGNATYHPSAGYTPGAAGDYWWYASYGGDGNNNTATSTCGSAMSETTVGQATPTLTATGPGTGTIGTAITTTNISSVLAASSGANATGTITFTVFGPQATAPTTCTTGGTTVGTGTTVAGNATYHPSAGYTPGAAGNYWWYASYGGDANNNTATSICGSTMSETTVAKAAPTVTAAGPGTGTIGTAITTANISSVLAGGTTTPAVTGTISFTVFGPQATAPTTCTTGGTTVGTGTTVAGNATYHPSAGYTPTGAGNYWWYASYAGDANNNTATSTCGSTMAETTVTKFAPTVTAGGPGTGTAGTAIAASSINSVLAGGTTAPAVTGTITFKVFGPQATAPTTCTTGGTTVGTGTTVAGNATYNPSAGYTPGAAGNYWWYASYGGDVNNNTATSTCGSTMSETVVGQAAPTITATGPGTGTAGTAVATANISSVLSGGTTAPAVTGTITFKVFGPLATAPTTCTTGGTTVGTGTTVAGNATYNPSAGYTPGAAGNYWWYASYGGDANNTTATSTCGSTMSETTVGQANPTLTAAGPGTGTIGTAITTANISSVLAGGTTVPAATGTITFTVFGPQATAPTTCTTGGTTVGTGTTVAGNATYHPTAGYTPTGAGNYWWYASYGGDANNNTATSTCGSTMSGTTVAKFTPTVTAAGPGTGTIGTAITTANISSVLAGGTSAPAVTGTISFTVFGPQATAPTTCTSGGTTVGTATVAGNATYHPSAGYTPTGAGNYWWYASYGGDANNNTATSTCGSGMSETTVAKFAPTVTAGGPGTGTAGTAIAASSINSVLAGGTTAPTVTGTITFTVFGPLATAPTTCTSGGTTVGTATVAGNATYNPSAGYTPTAIGDYWWYASYAGDANNNTATSTCGSGMTDTVVAKSGPTITATGPGTGTAGTAIATTNISSVLAASSGANATGTITFKVFGPLATAPTTCTTGGTTVGTGTTVAGNAAYNPSAGYTPGAAGNYWWYASYGGDANNTTATSTCGSTMSETVVAKASPTIATTLSAGTIMAGQTANDTSALSGAGTSTGTGTVVYSYYTNNTCTTGAVTVNTATVPTSGVVPNSSTVTFNSAGTYYWQAVYSGDTNNNGASSPCTASGNEQLTVNRAIAFVQQQTLNVSASGANVNSVPLTLPNTITTGDALVLVIADQSQNTSTVSGVTETGATWAKAQSTGSTADGDAEIWYALNVPSSASKTITVALTGTTNVQIADVSEYSGVATTSALDQKTSHTGSGTNSAPVSAGSVTPSENGELIVSDAYLSNGTGTQPAPSNGFTALTQSAGTSGNYKGYGAYLVDGASSSISTTWTGPGVGAYMWSAAIASFEP